jgi:hypothetical protein
MKFSQFLISRLLVFAGTLPLYNSSYGIEGDSMRKFLFIASFATILSAAACAPRAVAALPQPTGPVVSVATSPASESVPALNSYVNSDFGLRFQYPADWFGADEYFSGQTLRVAIGSDMVYPYGTSREEQVSTILDAYFIVVQFTRADDNSFTDETFDALAGMADGESLSNQRSLLIRVRRLVLGAYEGFEYIATLSESAQTEPIYARQVILRDDSSNTLTLMGAPNNVRIAAEEDWRAAYRRVDEAHLPIFRQILDTLVLE